LPHFINEYADQLNEALHAGFPGRFFKQEIIEVSDVLSSILVTYDNVLDDVREFRTMSLDDFLNRMSKLKADWSTMRDNLSRLRDDQDKTILGWEGRTIYFIRGGQHPDRWKRDRAIADAAKILASRPLGAELIYQQVKDLRKFVPVGHANFSNFERFVRITFNYLFSGELGDGQAQSRTEPENEGVEKRDIVFQNRATSGFWYDLKNKYSSSEVVVDAKNTDDLGRDDLRQLYCYLKPALGFWGFIVCRAAPTPLISSFNRTLFKNFEQKRGLLILSDDDLRRMVEMARRGESPSRYLQDRMSDFVRTI